MTNTARQWANRNYLNRLAEWGIKRFGMMAPIENKPSKPDSVLAALRRSPLVGADLDLSRPRIEGRKVEL